MTLEIPGAKITVEDDNVRYEFTTASAQIGSITGGASHFLSVGTLYNKVKTNLPEKEEAPVTTEEHTAPEPALTREQEAGLQAIRQTAQQIERQQFLNARAIQSAELEAQRGTEVVAHQFNMAVLEGLHTGLSQEAIEKHLFDAGFSQLEEKVDTVHMLDTELLYLESA